MEQIIEEAAAHIKSEWDKIPSMKELNETHTL